MSTPTTTPVFTPSGHDLSFGGMLQSEWIKLRSIRSTWWCFAILIVLTVGFGLIIGSTADLLGGPAPTGSAAQSVSAQAVTVGTALSSLVISVLGVLVISGEYGTGMIRSTLTAAPTRTPALLAKALVFAIVTFVVSSIAFLLTIPVAVSLLAGKGIDTDLGDPAYWLALLGGVGYLTLIGLFAFSIGAIVRNSAGGIAITLGIVLAAPTVLIVIGGITHVAWVTNLSRLLPSEAGGAMFGYPTDAPAASGSDLLVLEPWQGALVLGVWVVVLCIVASILLKRRDA